MGQSSGQHPAKRAKRDALCNAWNTKTPVKWGKVANPSAWGSKGCRFKSSQADQKVLIRDMSDRDFSLQRRTLCLAPA